MCEEREQPRAACAAAQPDLAALAGQLGIHQGGNPILREAESALERGDLLQAGARYLAVARGAPDMGEAWLGVSSVLLMTGEFDRATELIDRTIAEQDKAKAWVQLCRILMTLGEWERAEELVGRAISLKPSDAEAYSLQALILRNLGSDEEELQALKRAVQHSSDDPQLWETLITAFERVSGADAALDYLDGNRDAVPKMPAIDLRRVQLSMSAGRMREAEAGIERVLEAEPDNAEAHSIRAFVLLKSARREEAIEALQRATQCSPEDGQLWETLITVLEHLRGPEATLDYLASNGHKAPETLSMEVRKARLCISAGRTQEAEGRMRSILQANPDSAGVHSVHALLLSTTGRREDAIGALERATRYSPGDPRLWEALIRELEDVRGPERTVEYVGLNRNAVPRDRPLEERLVRLCLTVGKIEEATIWMRRLVEPDLDDVRAEDSFSEFLAEVAPEC